MHTTLPSSAPTTSVFNFPKRIAQVQSPIPDQTGWLLAGIHTIEYLTGFTFLVPEEREAFLLLTSRTATVIHTTFTEFQASSAIATRSGCSPKKLAEHLSELCAQHSLQTLALDKAYLYVEEFEAIQAILSSVTLTGLDTQPLKQLRAIKDTQEISALTMAGTIAGESLAAVWPRVKVGVTELQLKDWLDSEMKQRGSQQPAFPTIVCFGPHTALPHHQPTTTPLKANTPVLIDFGATYQGYRSDMTRTLWFGDTPSPLFTKISSCVMAAYQAGFHHLQHLSEVKKASPLADPVTVTAQSLDQATRSVIVTAGYGPQFIHTSGHGVGLDIHEYPSLNWSVSDALLPNMAITLEPGIYLPGELGYRYENTLLLSETGAKEITQLPS